MTETVEAFAMILTDQWPEPVKQVVGEITIAAAQLEHVLWVSPKRIKNLTITQWTRMTKKLSIPERCDQIEHLHAQRRMDQAREAVLGKLIKEVRRVNALRNSIIHARWGCKKVNGQITSHHRVWNSKQVGIDVRALSKLRDDIRNVRDAVGRFQW